MLPRWFSSGPGREGRRVASSPFSLIDDRCKKVDHPKAGSSVVLFSVDRWLVCCRLKVC